VFHSLACGLCAEREPGSLVDAQSIGKSQTKAVSDRVRHDPIVRRAPAARTPRKTSPGRG
jgi:hypothetical protein